ncbi:class I SAM-dependent methyltransferase [Thermoactinomyces sp. AMNI-1]|uniref:Class I SAM-dependent methyltransferase n=2 Tax=Thermoactinomyces mirandus TaxID=2756294 RepID=A0A7W1XSB3_9BACL|nr:class I SAM-dependent methyltransferase [Thermoactinomyces mirandus]
MILPSILQSAHQWAAKVLVPGGIAIDATVGNGHDTLFLAQQTGPDGQVFGFDIQKQAIDNTYKRLVHNNQHHQVKLFHCSHHQMQEKLPEQLGGNVHVVMFNLGYLPRGNHQLVTKPDTTLKALEAAIYYLMPGGLCTVALYTGHPGGQTESDQVIRWASSLPSRHYQVMWQQFVNRHQAPSLLIIEKR